MNKIISFEMKSIPEKQFYSLCAEILCDDGKIRPVGSHTFNELTVDFFQKFTDKLRDAVTANNYMEHSK